MSGYVPRWSAQMLEDYQRRMASCKPVTDQPKRGAAENAARKPVQATAAEPPALVPYQPTACLSVPCRAAEGKQTKTEQKYNRECLGGRGRFEPVALHLPGGGRYTPDFMTVDDGVVTFHEVKGSYRLGSQGRAYTAFHEAAAYYPMWRFVWAHWTGKKWERKTLPEIREMPI